MKNKVFSTLLIFMSCIVCAYATIDTKTQRCRSALISATYEGDVSKVAEIAADKITACPLDLEDCFDFTALMCASQLGHIDIVKVLLKNGATVDLQNKHGATALMIASANGYNKVVIELLKHGANPNLANKYGITPLMSAAGMGYVDVVTTLLQNGADPNKKNGHMSALSIAIKKNRDEVVKKLKETGAKPLSQN
jgi:ankyrin repeat protein